MRKKTRRVIKIVVEWVLLWGGVVGLIRWAGAIWPCVALWWNSRPVVISFGALSLVYLIWRLRRSVGAEERRSVTLPRTVTDKERASLSVAISKCEPQWVLIVTFLDDEACSFQEQLHMNIWNVSLALSKKWSPRFATDESSRTVTGVRVEVSADATKDEKSSAKAIHRWLHVEGFSDEGLRKMPDRSTCIFRQTNETVTFPIKITVGTR
jgi:hypothetical protein